MKRLLVFLFLSLVLTGCIHNEQLIVINKDGSGTFEDNLVVPEGSLYMSKVFFGNKMRGAMETMFPSGEIPLAFADDYYLNMDYTQFMDVFPKALIAMARQNGAKIEIVRFDKKFEDGALHIYLKMNFDNIVKLQKMNLGHLKLRLVKDTSGDLILFAEKDTKRAAMANARLEELKNIFNSDELSVLDPMVKEKMLAAMKDFQFKALISVPGEIKEVSGLLIKKDSNTAYSQIEGDLLEDVSLISKIFYLTVEPTRLVFSGKDLSFKVEEAASEPASAGATVSSGTAMVRVYLKDGRVLEGKLIEEAKDYIKVDIVGIPLTYFKEQIEKFEKVPR